MKPFLILLALWPGTMLAQSCGQELHEMKEAVKVKENQCKEEAKKLQDMSRYRREVLKLKKRFNIEKEVCL